MKSTDTLRKHPFHAAPAVNRHTGAIEWEELPSFADSLHKRLKRDFDDSTGFAAPSWDATMPAALEPVLEPEPVRAPIRGLATREVRDRDLFRHFFA